MHKLSYIRIHIFSGSNNMQSRRPDRCSDKSPSSNVAFSPLRQGFCPLRSDMISPLLQWHPKTSAKTLYDSMAGNKINFDGVFAMPSLTHRPAAAKAKKQVRFNTTVRGIFFETSTDNHEQIWYSHVYKFCMYNRASYDRREACKKMFGQIFWPQRFIRQ